MTETPTPAPPPRRPWWRRKRTWAAVVLFLAVMYPLSYGPVAYGVKMRWLPPFAYRLYRPLWWALPEDEPWVVLTDLFLDYSRFFHKAAERNAAAD